MRKLFYLFVGFSVVGTIVFLTGCNNNSGGGGNPGAGAAVPPAFFSTCGGVLNGASRGTVGFATYSAPIQGYHLFLQFVSCGHRHPLLLVQYKQNVKN